MSSIEDPTIAPVARSVPAKPPVHRWLGGDNRDVLGLGWLFGSFHVAVFRRQKMTGSWSAASPVKTIGEFDVALDAALAELQFGGTEVFLLLENEEFVHQIEATPPFADSVARNYLQARVQRHEVENAPVLWVGQPAAGMKKERSFILHMLPRNFYEAVNRVLLKRHLDLTRILPLVVPIQRELDRFPISKGRPVLVAVEAGGATVVLVAKVGEELLFARSLLATWSADPARIGVEINRSLLFANQQFGQTVERVWLLGQDNRATAEVNAKCGSGRQITVLPTSPVEWLQTVARLSPRHPVNLIAGYLRRKSLQRSVRRGVMAACWLGLMLVIADSWTASQSWQEEQRQYAVLRANEPMMHEERERLLARNASVQRERRLIAEVEDERLPAVPGKFAAYVASVLPPEIRLTEFAVRWEEADGGWRFQIDGLVEADEEGAREIVAGLQRQLTRSPLRVRFNDAGRPVAMQARNLGAAATARQRFSLEGGMLEN